MVRRLHEPAVSFILPMCRDIPTRSVGQQSERKDILRCVHVQALQVPAMSAMIHPVDNAGLFAGMYRHSFHLRIMNSTTVLPEISCTSSGSAEPCLHADDIQCFTALMQCSGHGIRKVGSRRSAAKVRSARICRRVFRRRRKHLAGSRPDDAVHGNIDPLLAEPVQFGIRDKSEER